MAFSIITKVDTHFGGFSLMVQGLIVVFDNGDRKCVSTVREGEKLLQDD